MNILFINANLYGHINPTLGLVKKLEERGHQVSYFCSEPFSEQVTKMGAKWIGYSENLEFFLKGYQPTDRHPFYMLMEYMLSYDEVVLPEIQDVINKNQFDMIICDSYFGGGCFLKQLTKIPVVCSHSSFAMSKTPLPERMLVPGFHPQLDNCNQILSRICEKYNIKEVTLEHVFISKGDLNVVYTTRDFNGDDNIQEPEYLFNGPSIESRQGNYLDFSVIGDRRLIYISLGSLNNHFVDFYRMSIAAFADSNYYVYMSIGEKCEVSQLGDIPSNFTIKSFLPQIDILKRADVFITHAGFNSVNEALYFGVPMFALPLVNDQYMVAKRLASMKLGICEDMKEMSAEILRAKTESLMADVEIKEKCMQSSLDMKNTANFEQTVLRLEDYINGLKEGD